jgi:hypothetical protein
VSQRENGLPKWWWELWRFILALEFRQIIEPDATILTIAGRPISADTASNLEGRPSWIDLPAMMKMRISTPHYMEQMKGKASPFGILDCGKSWSLPCSHLLARTVRTGLRLNASIASEAAICTPH